MATIDPPARSGAAWRGNGGGVNRPRPAAIAAVVVTLALLFGPGLLDHARFAADPWHFNDDARQYLWPMMRAAAPEHFGPDYVTDYYLANLPRGYRWLYAASAPVVDARTLSKVLPFVELLVVLYASMAASWQLAGAAAAWGTGALLLSTHVVLARMAGGLPRSFAFPLVAVAVLALVRGKPWRLCVLTALGAALYYPAAVLLAATTAAYLLALPPSWRGGATGWSLRRRLAILSLTAVAAATIVLPAFLAGRPFGPLLDHGDLAQYPEAGVGGRFKGIDLALPGRLTDIARAYAAAPLFSRGPAWSEALRDWSRRAAERPLVAATVWTIVAAGCLTLLVVDVRVRRLLLLAACAVALYGLALACWPLLLLPSRYLVYSLPLLTSVAMPASIAALLRRLPVLRARPAVAAALALGAVAALVVGLGGRGPGHAGIDIDVPPSQRPLQSFVAALPSDAVVAGWPDDVLDNVPYLSGRRILVGYEIHQVFHRAYADEMRRRLLALVSAYFSGDVHKLLQLRDDFGVTYLIVNRDYYGPTQPRYFKPFDAVVASAFRDRAAHPAALQQPAAVVFEDGPFVVLDLRRIEDD